MTEKTDATVSASLIRALLQAIREDASAYQWHLAIDKALAAASAPPLSPDPSALDDLLAYGEQEKESSRIGKDREQYQFWGGWVSALQRAKAVELASPASPPRAWQPISSAPKDGSPILLLEPPELTGRTIYGHIVVGAWRKHTGYSAGGSWSDGAYDVQATHWMPLPNPPGVTRAAP